MSVVGTSQLQSCGCIRKISAYPSEDKNYVEVKKKHLHHVITELVLHSSEHLVSVKACYGKQHASVNLLKSVCVSHVNDLKRLQDQIIIFESREKVILLSNTPKPLSLRLYFNACYDVCKLFHNLLTTCFQPTDPIPIHLLIECVKSEQLTLTFLGDVIKKNERSNENRLREDVQSKPENRSDQLEASSQPSI